MTTHYKYDNNSISSPTIKKKKTQKSTEKKGPSSPHHDIGSQEMNQLKTLLKKRLGNNVTEEQVNHYMDHFLNHYLKDEANQQQ